MNSLDCLGAVHGPLLGRPLESGDSTEWIEVAFSKRECNRYVASSKDATRCACGQTWAYHKTHGVENVGEPGEIWTPSLHTISNPTDSYGTIDFLGGPHPNKAQFIRLGFDSRPDLILQLMTREWGLELPKLIISVHGGKANFELHSRLKRVLRKGILRAAKTTGAWILTGGTNTGVTRHVGDALISERSPRLRGGRVVSIGIAPWGVVENRSTLVGRDKDVTYLSIDHPRSKFAVLNNRHACFLLADNGTVGRYGAEIALRRKLEKYISSQRLLARTSCSIPVVCVVIEGGMHTIRAVLEYVTDSPPVPVVVVEGSGRAADLLAFTHKYARAESDETSSLPDDVCEQLVTTIRRTFNVDLAQAEKLLAELLQCVKKKNLITIFRPSDSANTSDITGDGHELDHAILSALFRSRHLSASEQLSLALAWNRVDIARSEIFVYGQEWAEGALEEAMMEALIKNRVDFVKLLLETGVQMTKFLTIPRLEELYNSNQGPANTLRYIVRDVRTHMPRNYMYTLIDIGLVINKLMGGAYRSSYTRRKFRHIYSTLMKRPAASLNQSALARVYSNHLLRNGVNGSGQPGQHNNSILDDTNHLTELSATSLFAQPFNELLVWSVLTKRQAMAKLMWQHGEEALAKALVASKLYRAMASEAADDDLEVEVYDELRQYSAEFNREALELLDYCYRQDDDLAQQLLTCELTNWSRQTCLRLAFVCRHRDLLAHPCSQLILGDLWMGGLRTRRSTNLKVVLGLLCPPLILKLEFKSKEELQLMPQTEEEHMIDLKDERDNNTSSDHSSSNSSASSSPSHSPRSERSLSQTSHKQNQQQVRQSANAAVPSTAIITPHDSTPVSNAPVATSEGIGASFHYERRRMRQLRIKKKLYEFYAAPITKFWFWSMAYFFFLFVYTYTMLIRTPSTPEWNELYVILHMGSFGCEKIREIAASEPVKLSHKVSVWTSDVWNCCDALFVVEFFIAMIFRLQSGYTLQVGRVLYCLNIVYWYIRILRILSVSKFLGPFVTMIGRMLEKMIYYIVLMMVVLMAYGVFRQSLLFPNEEFDWNLVRDIFFKPYFMIYGELFAGDIYPRPCNETEAADGDWNPCVTTGGWLNPLLMTCYLLVANILLLNLLIAVFNSIFLKTHVFSHQIWKFNRFNVVMDYEQKPALPPPLIIFSHIYLVIKWCRRRSKGMVESYDYGLKLFLDSDDLERLYDFEEESMEGLVREREAKLHLSTEERVRLIGERLDGMGSKIEDAYQKCAHQTDGLQSLDYRMMRLEEVSEQINASLAVIHRFMAFQNQSSTSALMGSGGPGSLTQSSPNIDQPNVVVPPLPTEDDFMRHLALDRARRSSGAAFEPQDEEIFEECDAEATDSIPQAVEAHNITKLRSFTVSGHRELTRQERKRNMSESSNDEIKMLRSMEEAKEIELSESALKEDDLVTTRAIASLDSQSQLGGYDDDDELTEVFDHVTEMDDAVDSSTNVLLTASASSPVYQRSFSVGCSAGGSNNQQPQQTGVELRKRFRNLSGTAGSSDRGGQRQQRLRSPAPVDEKLCPECQSSSAMRHEQGEQRLRQRLQPMLSCPPGTSANKWSGSSCAACQMLRSSFSCGSFTPQPPLQSDATAVNPKINIIPPSTTHQRSTRAGSTGNQPDKVEAEAEHLREIEGQDYHMMEGIIRRRLHRDSEDLDNSLEDLCNAPIPLDDTLDSFDEAQENQAVNFILESFESSDEAEQGATAARLFTNLAATVLSTVGVQPAGPEQRTKIPPPRPSAPPKLQHQKSVNEELVLLKEPSKKGDRTDVAINVEDDVC